MSAADSPFSVVASDGPAGPCGPCSEIHIDLTQDGCDAKEVNSGNPDVISLAYRHNYCQAFKTMNLSEDKKELVANAMQVEIMKARLASITEIAKMITEHSKKGENVVIEISPKFFSTWDYGKMQVL